MIISPKKPDFKTYLRLCATRHSLSRFMTNSIISGIHFLRGGGVLDLGGEPHSPKTQNYKSLFSGYDFWLTLNINPDCVPDFICDCNSPLPFEDARFDHVVSISALEHIKNIDLAVSGTVRITKPKGLLYYLFHFFLESMEIRTIITVQQPLGGGINWKS